MENINFDDMEVIKNIPVENDLFEITNDFIVAGMSGNGGFNYAQLKLLGVETPPKTGWKERIIGTKIPRNIAKQYLEMKGKTKSVVKKEKIKAIQEDLFSEKTDTVELSESEIKEVIEALESLDEHGRKVLIKFIKDMAKAYKTEKEKYPPSICKNSV